MVNDNNNLIFFFNDYNFLWKESLGNHAVHLCSLTPQNFWIYLTPLKQIWHKHLIFCRVCGRRQPVSLEMAKWRWFEDEPTLHQSSGPQHRSYQSQSALRCRIIRPNLGNCRAHGQYSKCLQHAIHVLHWVFGLSWATVGRANIFHAQRKKRPSYEA